MEDRWRDSLARTVRAAVHTAVSLLMLWAVAQFRMFSALETRVIKAESRLAACEKKVKADEESRLRLHE